MLAVKCTNLGRDFVVPGSFLSKASVVTAIDGLDLTVEQGQIFGLLGPNGAGKTTTIRILSTLLTPTSGNASILGYDVVLHPAVVRTKIGLILGGDKGFYGRLTAYENLRYWASLNRISWTLAQPRADELLYWADLLGAKDRLVDRYSRGMKQRLHIVRALLPDPQILFMDEPTLGLDPQGASDLRRLIPEMTESGKTILLTTHIMREADELCHNLGIMHHGRLIASGSPAEIRGRLAGLEAVDLTLPTRDWFGIQNFSEITDAKVILNPSEGTEWKLTILYTAQSSTKKRVQSVLMALADGLYWQERNSNLEEAYLWLIDRASTAEMST